MNPVNPLSVILSANGVGAAEEGAVMRMPSSSSEDETKKKTNRKRKVDPEKRTQPLRTLKQYMIEEKLDIINFAKQMGNRAAGREYNVAESSIREWRKNEERLRATLQTEPNRNRLVGGGRKPTIEKKKEEQEESFQPEIVQVPLSLRLMGDESRDTLNSSGCSMGMSGEEPSASPSPNISDEKKTRFNDQKVTATEQQNPHLSFNQSIVLQSQLPFPLVSNPLQANLLQQIIAKNPGALIAAFNSYPSLFPNLQHLKAVDSQAQPLSGTSSVSSSGSRKRKAKTPQRVVLDEENEEKLPIS